MSHHGTVPGYGDLQCTSPVKRFVREHFIGRHDDVAYTFTKADARDLCSVFAMELEAGNFKIQDSNELRAFTMLTHFVDAIAEWGHREDGYFVNDVTEIHFC